MPRTARASVGNVIYHVLNRGNARAEVFHKPDDYAAFQELLGKATERVPVRVLAWCLMPNHFHLVLWPRAEGDLGRFMQWLLTSHVRRYHRHYHTSGHVWQGRFKAFPVQGDEHLLTLVRYVERNPLRAQLVRKAESWSWSSLHARRQPQPPAWLVAGPVRRPTNWLGARQHPADRRRASGDRPLAGARHAAGRRGVDTSHGAAVRPRINPPPPREAAEGRKKVECPLFCPQKR